MVSTSSPSSAVADARALFEVAVRAGQADRLIDASDADSWAPAPIDTYEAVRVAGMGKAAMAMAGVLEARCADAVADGTVVVPEGYPETCPDRLPAPATVRVMEGGHPLPTAGSVRAARRLLDHAEAVGEGDLLLVPVSGGGTALSTLPADALDLADLKTTYHRMMAAGVPIHAANTVRKHLTQLGGGQLARAAHPAAVAGLAVSDVPGDALSVIASGPTVPDPSTYADALRVLYRHGLWHDVPAAVRDHLTAGARGRRAETPGADHSCFERARTRLVGSNRTALEAARAAAEERGYRVRVVEADVEGEARDVGRDHATTILDAAPDEPTCWLWGGETTVTVAGGGTGGRNQEVALGAALAMEGTDRSAVLLSGGTDGVDGPTDAAGAWATPSTAHRARAVGCEPEAHLEENDAYPLFDAIDQLVRPGPTHTNVMDVHIGLVQPAS
jgi:hydroxypyruvate reductase